VRKARKLSCAISHRFTALARLEFTLTELMETIPSIDARTVDQTLIGIYWGYDGAKGLGTPPRLYNQIVRVIAAARGNTVAQNARLFALLNVAMALPASWPGIRSIAMICGGLWWA
jgi:hypothetical protein